MHPKHGGNSALARRGSTEPVRYAFDPWNSMAKTCDAAHVTSAAKLWSGFYGGPATASYCPGTWTAIGRPCYAHQMHMVSRSDGPKVSTLATRAAMSVQVTAQCKNVPVGPKTGSGPARPMSRHIQPITIR